jgi:hypothetical protein
MNLECKITGKAKGFVLDNKTDKIIYESDWTKNLITNDGLNMMAQWDSLSLKKGFVFWPFENVNNDNGNHLHYGTGSTPNSFSSTICSTPVSAEQIDNVINLSSPFGYALSGTVLKYEDGTSTFITSANSTSLISKKLLNKSLQHFEIYNTNIKSLYEFVEKSNTDYSNSELGLFGDQMGYYTDLGYATATLVKQFSDNTGPNTINVWEVGCAASYYDSNILASRLVFNTPIPIEPNQKLILKYDFKVEVPLLSANQKMNYNITGWPTASGDVGFFNGIGDNTNSIFGSKSLVGYTLSYPDYIGVFEDNRNFSANNTPPLTGQIYSYNNLNDTLLPYEENSFKHTIKYEFNPLSPSSDFNSSNIGSIVFNNTNNNTNNVTSFRMNFDQKQTKLSNQKLIIYLTKSVSRDV